MLSGESGTVRVWGSIAEQSSPLIAASTDCPSHRFGLPFVLHLSKTIAWDILQKEILEKMQYFLRPAACLQVRQISLFETSSSVTGTEGMEASYLQ